MQSSRQRGARDACEGIHEYHKKSNIVKNLSINLVLILVCVAVFLMSQAAQAVDIVSDWNKNLRDVMQDVPAKANPGTSTRAMAMTNGAIYDIFQAVNRTHAPLLFKRKVSDVSLEAAVAQAAYRTIVSSYVEEKVFLDDQFNWSLNAIADSPEKVAGIALGNEVADKYIAWREGDGSELSGTYQFNNQPGHWQSDPFALVPQVAWGPGWGTVKTF